MTSKGAKTTPSQDAMLEHLAYLVLHENRPASWRDFQNFAVDSRVYSLKQGTIRNNLSRLRRLRLIELSYRSIDAYYTLYGCTNLTTTTMMTFNHARVYKPDLAALIERMAFDTPSAHDIHLRFKVGRIWKTLSVLATLPAVTMVRNKRPSSDTSTNASYSSSQRLATRAVSKDIVVPVMALESGIQGRLTIHKNDTVSVIFSCSESPIKFNIGGLVRLTCSLVRIEERLRSLIDHAQQQETPLVHYSAELAAYRQQQSANITATITPINSSTSPKLLVVPHCGSWIVTMWHIAFDSLERYTGDKFEVSWEDFTGEWIRVYSKYLVLDKPTVKWMKKAGKKGIIRMERQEYPKDRLRTVVEHKLSLIGVASQKASYNVVNSSLSSI